MPKQIEIIKSFVLEDITKRHNNKGYGKNKGIETIDETAMPG